MYQELALPLAHAYASDWPGNAWRGEPRIRDIALAAVRFAARSAHRDTSCDDYYPYERALGATAFVAAAHARTLAILDARDADLLEFASRRAWWLARRDESGRLTNHHALVALAAARTAALVNDAALEGAAKERLGRCLEWQHQEGWFPEYEGADLGYQSLTIAFLAALRSHLPSSDLDRALGKACGFLAHFLHPDGSLGGEVGSRNTCQVLPSGFERLAAEIPAARALADGWLAGAMAGKRGYPDDDRIVCHWMADFPEACAARTGRLDAAAPAWSRTAGRTSFPGCGLHAISEGPLHLVVATSKGGTFRAFAGTRLLHSDSGLVGLTRTDERLVMHAVDGEARPEWTERAVTVRGDFHAPKRRLATPFKQVVFRIVNGTLGRMFPGLVRKLLQRALITGRKVAPYRFERTIAWSAEGAVEVRDVVTKAPDAPEIQRMLASTDATSIYVATSNLWQDASREAWTELPDLASDLQARGRGEVTRRWS
jgi:hypothetical protein